MPKPKRGAWESVRLRMEKRQSLQGIASEARGGDAECAMDMVRISVAEMEDASGFTPEVKQYLLDCLSRIESGETADHAFNFKRYRKGAPRYLWKDLRDRDIAQAVAFQVDQGNTVEEACELVAETYQGLSRIAGTVNLRSIKTAYNRFFSQDQGE